MYSSGEKHSLHLLHILFYRLSELHGCFDKSLCSRLLTCTLGPQVFSILNDIACKDYRYSLMARCKEHFSLLHFPSCSYWSLLRVSKIFTAVLLWFDGNVSGYFFDCFNLSFGLATLSFRLENPTINYVSLFARYWNIIFLLFLCVSSFAIVTC